jgi:site-specific recombinase XerD
MAKPLLLQFRTDDRGKSFATVVESYNDHLQTGRYGPRCRRYVASVVHFGHWLTGEGFAATNVDEAVIGRFLLEHLPRCECTRPVPLRMIEVRAALNLLLRLLRAQGVAAIPATDEIERELADFDAKMVEVWGLARGTRDHRCRIIRRFLHAQFGDKPIILASIRSTDIRSFVLGEPSWSASTIRVAGGAVRCWLRYRALLGEKTAELQHAVPSPAYYRQTSLPDTLSESELNELFASFDTPCPSRRRGYAIVRCLADLGLRCSEVVGLRLDDVDWAAGTIHIAAGKVRSADVLPLPTATGAAIADYLVYERPTTDCRAIFVRHVAPLGEPVGRRVVQQAMHAAYRRCGWDRTRVHILRHTLGSRLVNAGTPMKQIADVLRHRSIVTSATYARVDVAHLSAVALPWPGSAA